MLSRPNCYGGVRVDDYGTLEECMQALHAQPGDLVLFGGYVVSYLCKDGKYHYAGISSHGGKKKVNGYYVRGEGGLFVWGHAAIYAGQNFTHVDKKGNVRKGQWFYETSRNVRSGLHWREPRYYAGKTNTRVMVIHIGNPTAQKEKTVIDPVRKVLGKDAVTGGKYGIYKSQEDAARDYNRLCTVTCGATYDMPEINLGSASTYDVATGLKLSARFYMRRLSYDGTLIPEEKSHLFRLHASDKNDVPTGWVKLGS